MGRSGLPSMRLLGGPTVRAMALVEVLVAAAILGAAMLAFLGVYRDARGDLASARMRAEASALALTLLSEARTTWAIIDKATGRPLRVPPEVAAPFLA